MIPNQIPVHDRPTDERTHPTRVPKPSHAQVKSSEYLKCEENAREAGKYWANDLEFLLVPDNEDPEDIIVLKASEISNLPEPENKWTPSHYGEAMMKPDLWVPAMDAEIWRMEERDVQEVIPREPWMKMIDTRWVFDIKLDGDLGSLLKRQARLVVKGFSQIKALHYFKSFVVVVRYESLRMFFAIVAAQGLDFWLIDFVRAYLNAEPQGENYVNLPQGYEDVITRDLPPGDYVLRMCRVMYGTMDAGNAWFHELNKMFAALGHIQSRADPCVRLLKRGREWTITCTYTDNVSGASSSKAEGELVRRELGEVYDIKDMGSHNSVLGMMVEFNDIAGSISLHQKNLILKTLERFGMLDCKPNATPLPIGTLAALDTQPRPIPVSDKEFMAHRDYRAVLGSLNHIANGTRPDIAFATNYLQRFASDP